MRAPAGFILILLLVAPLSVAAARGDGEIAGTVINITCPGPCRPGATGAPFLGAAIVEVRRHGDQRLIARAPVVASQFGLSVRSGHYDVTVIPYPMQHPTCWRGSTQPARVSRGQTVTLQLTVANGCIV